jgi:hypothetical protein
MSARLMALDIVAQVRGIQERRARQARRFARRMMRPAFSALPWLGVRALGFGDGYVVPHSVMACKDPACSVCASLPGVRYRGRR